ncbi:DUF6193 family natural product biosynthesis protein [Streptomyces sp. NPDC048257]|uniref:DUF6193 family natural product biosynthesis protein n=1 Tax=Streptomyces sp. NPDC048257 TaxID=3365526 RepID=UPI003713187B
MEAQPQLLQHVVEKCRSLRLFAPEEAGQHGEGGTFNPGNQPVQTCLDESVRPDVPTEGPLARDVAELFESVVAGHHSLLDRYLGEEARISADSAAIEWLWLNFCGVACTCGGCGGRLARHRSLGVSDTSPPMDTAGTAEEIVENEWVRLLASDCVDAGLVRVAFAEPGLRQLFPRVGMWELHFSRCAEHPCTWDVPYIAPRRGGGFLVAGPSRVEYVGEADTADAAVEMVANCVPPDCGPAVVRNRHDLAALAQEG